MGFDYFCSITGGRYLDTVSEVAEVLQRDIPLGKTVKKSLNRLIYSSEDVEASKDYIILAFGTLQAANGLEFPYRNELPKKGDVEIFHDVMPGEFPDLGDYISAANPSNRYTIVPRVNAYLVTFTSYQILRHVCPQLEPHHLFQLFSRSRQVYDHRQNGIVHGINYGPLEQVHDHRYAYWPAMAEISEELEDEEAIWWEQFLNHPEQTDDEIVEKAWMGPGNLWAMVRPDRFPVPETLDMGPLIDCGDYMAENDADIFPATFDSLPFDILELIADLLPIESLSTLISISRHSRALMLPCIHYIAYLRLLEEPWLFPVPTLPGRLHTTRPKEETEYWVDGWGKGGIEEDDIIADAPWLNYARACRKSRSMRNRKRIWNISLQFGALAYEDGILES